MFEQKYVRLNYIGEMFYHCDSIKIGCQTLNLIQSIFKLIEINSHNSCNSDNITFSVLFSPKLTILL